MKSNPHGGRSVVLVVDDHEDTRQMSLLVLRTQGFEASAAASGDDAFRRAVESQPDVIITDLSMPDGDGWDLLKLLGSDSRTKHIPVVMLTGCANDGIRRRAREEGCAAFFFKPCAPDVLANELRRLIGARTLPSA